MLTSGVTSFLRRQFLGQTFSILSCFVYVAMYKDRKAEPDPEKLVPVRALGLLFKPMFGVTALCLVASAVSIYTPLGGPAWCPSHPPVHLTRAVSWGIF